MSLEDMHGDYWMPYEERNKTAMSEDKFEWTDDLVTEYAINTHFSNQKSLQEFKKTKQQKQKDWEIVEFKFRSGGVVNVECSHIDNTDKYLKSRMESLKETGSHIHSVKRLSDGEVFHVGDKFMVHPGFNTHEIKSFRVDGMCMAVLAEDFPKYTYYLPHLEKAKQPLFKTEDGKDIYEGDEYWVLWDIQYHFRNNSTPKTDKRIATDKPDVSYSKFFSTEEAAKEYVLMNKPCLSYSDVIEIGGYWAKSEGDGHYTHVSTIRLKELVEQKINSK